MHKRAFPDEQWETISPEEAGFHPERLEKAKKWQEEKLQGQPYRLALVRGGRLVLEWYSGMASGDKPGIASAAKSLYSNVLGIVVADGKLTSADHRVFDVYPEFMDVPEGEGPKEARYAYETNRDITFRQLICNTSGYMKPGEEPGRVFNYQTFGMNVLTHALAKLYGLYDISDPEGSKGFRVLVDDKIAQPIGAGFEYSLKNFDLPAEARINIFGYYSAVHTTALDAARLGWLWCNWGRWDSVQVIPEAWMRDSVKVAPDILANCPEDQWEYGHGIWTNERGRLWPDLPQDGFSACGAGGHYITVFPSKELVIVQNPGFYGGPNGRANPAFLELVLKACP